MLTLFIVSGSVVIRNFMTRRGSLQHNKVNAILTSSPFDLCKRSMIQDIDEWKENRDAVFRQIGIANDSGQNL